MNILRLKILRIITYLATLIWVVTGLVTIGSIYLSRIGFVINLLVGKSFILLGTYFYFKEKALSELLEITYQDQFSKLHNKVFLGEFFFMMFALLVGIIILSAVSSRVFKEGFAVFG